MAEEAEIVQDEYGVSSMFPCRIIASRIVCVYAETSLVTL
jgi:hypothetical protein